MNYFDSELNIIEWFQKAGCKCRYIPDKNDELLRVFNAIYDTEKWSYWKNSSGKKDPPPDFYSDEFKLMMEVMRVDDHSHLNDKGKIVNPTNALESDLKKRLKKFFPSSDIINPENFFVNVPTNLPTDEDHSYEFYKNNFTHVVNKHKCKIDMYKKNHPDFKTVFFVFDESTAYVESEKDISKTHEGMTVAGKLHIWFLDKQFLNCFVNSNIDYLVWYTPFKHFIMDNERNTNIKLLELSDVLIFDTKVPFEDNREYDANKMVSLEE